MNYDKFLKDGKATYGGVFTGSDSNFKKMQKLNVILETKPEIIRVLLPEPLEPLEKPYLVLYAADFPTVNEKGEVTGCAYKECSIYIPTKTKAFPGCVGLYPLSMIVNVDMVMYIGNGMWGIPMKLGNITFHYDEDEKELGVIVMRDGIPLCNIFANFNTKANAPDLDEALSIIRPRDPEYPGRGVLFPFKWNHNKFVKDADKSVFYHTPYLIKLHDEEIPLAPRQIGSADVKIFRSENDPWKSIEIVRILGATYDLQDYNMFGTYDAVDVPNEKEFEKHAFRAFDIIGGNQI